MSLEGGKSVNIGSAVVTAVVSMRNGLEDLARSLAKSTRLLFLFSCASPFLPLRKWIGSMRGGYRRSNIDRMFPSINSLGVLDTSFGGCVRGEVNERAKKYTRTQKRERERERVCVSINSQSNFRFREVDG